MFYYKNFTYLLSFSLVASGINSELDVPEVHDENVATLHQESSEKPTELVTEQPKSPKKELEPLIETIGTVYPKYKSSLSSLVAGRVHEVMVEVGDEVKKDQPLARIDPLFFEIALRQKEVALSSAKVELQEAFLNFSRMRKLWEKPEGETPSIPQKRFDDAKIEYKQALNGLRLAEENVKRAKADLDEAVVKAPYDGVITKRFLDPGECVTAQTKIVELQHIDSVFVEFSIGQLDLKKIQVGKPIKVEEEGNEKIATIDLIHPEVDEKTRSVTCRAYLSRKEHELKPGSLLKVTIYPEEEFLTHSGAQ